MLSDQPDRVSRIPGIILLLGPRQSTLVTRWLSRNLRVGVWGRAISVPWHSQIWNAETYVSAPDNNEAMEPFSVRLFLVSVGKDSYIPNLTSGGYVTLSKCVELTEQDLEKIGVPYFFDGRSDYAGSRTSDIYYNYIYNRMYINLYVSMSWFEFIGFTW